MKKMIKLKPQKGNFKQINFIEATGKLYLEDYNNNTFECNLYGSKTPTFYPNITGFAGFSQRQEKTNLPSLTFKPHETQYFPQPRFFEGYSQFPRPLCKPFMNVINKPLSLHNMLTQENRLKNNKKNKQLITIEGSEGLHYLTSTLANDETEIKEHLINSINNYVTEFKLKNKHKPELANQDHSIQALKKFRRMLKINYATNFVNGKVLNYPHEALHQQYNLIKTNFMIPQNKRHLTIEGSGNCNIDNKMINLLSQNSTLERTNTAFSFGKTSMNFTPRKLQQKQADLSFMSNENKGNSQIDGNENKEKSNKTILFKCSEEKRLLTGFQPIRFKEEAIIQKGKPKMLTPKDLYMKELILMQKVNPIVIKREKEKTECDCKVLEKKKQNKLIYEKIKIVKKITLK